MLVGFGAISAAASALYIVNDLLDLETDPRHPRKRHRPFAAGELTIADGVVLACLMLWTTIVTGALLSTSAQMLLGVYILMSAAYTGVLKRKLFLDVATLAALYTLRLFFGGALLSALLP